MKSHRTITTTQKSISPISCTDHDYIEIACLYRYELLIELNDGETINTRATNIVSKKNREGVSIEYLITESPTLIVEIPLNEIFRIKTNTKNAKFKSLKLAEKPCQL